MYEMLKGRVLRLLKVPPEPTDPMGGEGTLKVFRAAKNYYKYRLYLWTGGRLLVIPGAILAAVFGGVGFTFANLPFLAVLFTAVGALGLLLLVVQSIVSYITLRLDYEMRWYKVTDRSLRIREGIWLVREMTMTFANIQNISITQGPIQRYLGISDLKVQTAGGGGASSSEEHKQQYGGLDMHTGYFRGVDNAAEIRELILSRLRRLRDSGLGDTDDTHNEGAESAVTPGAGLAVSNDVMAVLRDLRAEAAAFRQAAVSLEGQM